jgi:hypothetical protein
MKTIALIGSVLLAGLLLVPTSQAAPSCCDPNQAQSPAGILTSSPQAGSAFPIAPNNAYTQPMPQNIRPTPPGPRNLSASQRPAPYYPAPFVPVQAVSVGPPTNLMAAAPGQCGCGARFNTAGYPAPSVSCCGGRGLNFPRQAVTPSGSVPSCCEGQVKPAASVPSCCAGKVKEAAPVPSCCAVGQKTSGLVPQFTKSSGKARNSYLPLQAAPAGLRADVQPNMAPAMRVLSNGKAVLRFGSLW